MDSPLAQWVPTPRKPTAREVVTTFLLLLPLFASLVYRLYAKIRRRDGRSVGLQILSDERDNDHVKYEIIAVHGLGASPEHTWTCRSKPTPKNGDGRKSVHLLKDLLMKDGRFSDARILHFSYNSDWLVDACFESARDIGLRLIESLIEHRKTHARLPLLFVGHSFGGIVIKEALSSDLEDTQRILEDTCGIIFLGTPHLGSLVADFGATLAYLTGFLGSNTGLLLLLRSNSEMLVNLSIAFQSCLERKYQDLDKKTKIVSICEQKPTYLLNWLYAGLIVPLASATFGTNFMEVFKVDKDHSGLNKCPNSEDSLYKVLTAQLHKIRPTAPPKINTLQQAVLDRLTSVTAADAEFHPGLDDYGRGRSECLTQTREEILKDICDWLDGNTMARQNRIAANFFFKRGEGDRARLGRFFTTLTSQLVRQWPGFAKAFKKFIQEPIRKQKHNKSKMIIIIVDAHDECDSSEDLTSLAQQLTQSQDGHSPQALVKCFLTSRFDHHSQSSFTSISQESCEKRELEKATSLYGSIIDRRFDDLDDQCHEKAEANFQNIIGSVIFLANAVTVRCLAELLELPETEVREELQLFESVLVVPAEQDDQSPIKLFHESFRDFLSGSGTKKKLIIDHKQVHTLLASRCHQLLRGALRENMCALKTPGTHRSEVAEETINEFLPEKVQYACRFWIFHVKRSQSSVKDGDDWHSFLLSHLLHWLEAMSLLGRTSESASLIKELKDIVHPSDGVQFKAFLEDAERLILSFRHAIDAAPLQLYSSVLTFAPAKSLVRERFDTNRAKWISCIPNVNSHWSPCLQTLEGHARSIKCVSFSSDGILASADEGNVVKVWDPIVGTCLPTFSMNGRWKPWIIAMAFSKAGKLACMAAGNLSVWDIRREVCLQTLDLMQYVRRSAFQDTGSVVFEDETRLLLAGAGLRTVLKLELGHECEEETNLPFHSVPTILSPDGQWVAYAVQGDIRILAMNSKTTRSPKTLKGSISNSDYLNACFSQDNLYFASIQDKSEAKIWDVSSTMCLQVFSEINQISTLAFSQDSHLLGMGGEWDWKISIWDWKKHTLLRAFPGHQRRAHSLSFSPDGAWVASASYDCTVKIWDDAIRDYEEKNASHFRAARNMLAMGGQRLAMISAETSEFQLLDDDSGRKCAAQPFKKTYGNMAISANGNIFAAVLDDRTGVEIWDAESDKFLPLYSFPPFTRNDPSICSIALSANGERLIIGLTNSTAKVWESRTGRLLKELKGEEIDSTSRTGVAISRDGEQFAWTRLDKEKNVSVYTEKMHLAVPDKLQPYMNPSPELAFSPNGKRLAAVGFWRGAFWDVTTGTCLMTFNHADWLIWVLDTSFINFDFTVGTDLPEHKECEDYLTKDYVSPDGFWVMRNREKLLWILPEYRPRGAVVSGSKIVIERISGPPFVMQLLDDEL
ncbi:WD40-repeat-containing domain protein [Trichoderma pleuroticola]